MFAMEFHGSYLLSIAKKPVLCVICYCLPGAADGPIQMKERPRSFSQLRFFSCSLSSVDCTSANVKMISKFIHKSSKANIIIKKFRSHTKQDASRRGIQWIVINLSERLPNYGQSFQNFVESDLCRGRYLQTDEPGEKHAIERQNGIVFRTAYRR